MNVGYLLSNSANKYPERVAVILEEGRRTFKAFNQRTNRLANAMYTSGTTGKPKGALLTHRNVLWNIFNTIWARQDKSVERALIVGPLYHTAALNNHLTIQIALGGTSIIIPKFEPESLLRIIEKENNISLPAGEIGELICRGPNVMQAYHRNPQGTKESIQDGWLCTGEIRLCV